MAGSVELEIPQFCIDMVTRCLRNGEDSVVQHYAVKAIENVRSVS